MERNGRPVYLQEKEVSDWLEKHRMEMKGKAVGTINTSMLEYVLNENPFIKEAQVYLTEDAVLHIEVSQRNPMLKVFNTNGQVFNIDEDGVEMPNNSNFPLRIRIANGNIPFIGHPGLRIWAIADTSPAKVLKEVFLLSNSISKDTVLDALIEQIYVNAIGEYELVPKVGGQIIVFGSIKDMDEKLERLKLFYMQGIAKRGWDVYRILNLKYKDQVVCTKK
ncbi:MAG: hypothetical protein RSA02_04835 [Bacteroidales bacterium]